MTIIMFCVVNFFTKPPAGDVLKKVVSVDSHYYKILKYEAGHVEKLKFCKKIFHKRADLAWFYDAK